MSGGNPSQDGETFTTDINAGDQGAILRINDFGEGGIYPILYAFFDSNGALDRNAWRQQIEAVIAAGAPGIAILGLITEVAALSLEERRTLVAWAKEDIADRIPLIATIAGKDQNEAASLAKDAEAAGASALIMQPPLNVKCSESELIEFFAGIMKQVSVPVGIQNAPEYLGVGLSAPSVLLLAERCDNFRLMKGEGPVSIVKTYIEQLSPQIAIFNGRGGLELSDNLRAGCYGIVPAPDCADLQIALHQAFRKKDETLMDAIYKDILPYIVFAMQSLDIAIAYGKRMFAMRAGIENDCTCRIVASATDPFLLDSMQRWSKRFGPYTRASGVSR